MAIQTVSDIRASSDPNMALTYDPGAGKASETSASAPAPAAAPGLAPGWVSTAFGLVQLLAPRTFLNMVGMPYPPWLIRAVGARDLLLGLGMLGQPGSLNWRRVRFVNDVMDTGLIGAAVFWPSTDRRRLAAFAAVAAGVIAMDARSARDDPGKQFEQSRTP